MLRQGYLGLVAQDHVQMALEYFQGWSFGGSSFGIVSS